MELSANGFEMERIKIDTVHKWQPPKNVKSVHEFIGFCNFYQRFVKNFAEITHPLHDLTKQDQKWEWTHQQQHAFQTLKDAICASPVLIHANPDERFHVKTDTSNYAYGAVLSQKSRQDQKQHPVAFFSKSMTPAERNYGILDKEALAVVKALQHWRHWLEGTKIPVEILTDHKNLKHFTKPRILNRRQLRWLDLLSHYNYLISYQPGNHNGAADALSRKGELAPINPEEEEPTVMIPRDRFTEIAGMVADIDTDEQDDALIAAMKVMVELDQGIQEWIKACVVEAQLPKDVQLVDGLPHHDGRIYIPNDTGIKAQVLTLYHDLLMAGHLGQQGTLDLVTQLYWWPGVTDYVKDYVKGC